MPVNTASTPPGVSNATSRRAPRDRRLQAHLAGPARVAQMRRGDFFDRRRGVVLIAQPFHAHVPSRRDHGQRDAGAFATDAKRLLRNAAVLKALGARLDLEGIGGVHARGEKRTVPPPAGVAPGLRIPTRRGQPAECGTGEPAGAGVPDVRARVCQVAGPMIEDAAEPQEHPVFHEWPLNGKWRDDLARRPERESAVRLPDVAREPGDDVHHSARGIPAPDHTLRPSDHLDPLDIDQGCRQAHARIDRHVVDVNADRRVVADQQCERLGGVGVVVHDQHAPLHPERRDGRGRAVRHRLNPVEDGHVDRKLIAARFASTAALSISESAAACRCR